MPSLAANFEEENVFTRLLFEDEEGIAHGNDWARGFMRGVHFQSFSLAGKQRFLSLRFGQKYKTAAEKPQDEGRAGRVEQGRGFSRRPIALLETLVFGTQ